MLVRDASNTTIQYKQQRAIGALERIVVHTQRRDLSPSRCPNRSYGSATFPSFSTHLHYSMAISCLCHKAGD